MAESLGFNFSHLKKQLLIALLLFVVTITVFIILPLLLGFPKEEVLSFKVTKPLILVYYILKSIFIVGLGEELIFRGYFYEKIKLISNSGLGTVIITSVVFGLWHYPVGGNILQVLVTTVFGLIYGFSRLKLKNCSTLATGIGHGLHDAVIIILSSAL